MTQPKLTNLEMSSDEFVAWASQSRTAEAYELICGEVVAMAPERMAHSNAKSALAGQLLSQLAGLPCRIHIDGIQVKVGDDSVFQPDLLIHCGSAPRDVTFVTDPVLVIEILSPSTRSFDMLRKAPLYLSLPSLVSLILIDPDDRRALIHRKGDGSGLPQAVEGAGEIVEFDIGGGKLAIDFARVFDAAGA